jgi:iron(III) transport system ATP-binding protein
MPDITLRGIDKSYVSGQLAVSGLDLAIPAGSFMCLLGPSGCGKTTTLRMIGGLEQPTAGEISVGGRVLDSVARGVFVPPEKRQMGLVFQSYALWPHLTVAKNVEFGLRMQHVGSAERQRRVQQVLQTLRIAEVAKRYPGQLSGGQQQRVALARMLVVKPDVLLLDEPLSNLDAQLRLEMRAELKRIHAEFGSTIVFVTHDQLEAMTLATHVAVMNTGVLEQFGAPLEIYHRPASRFVAGFVGSPPMNVVSTDDADDPLARSLSDYVSRRVLGLPAIGGVGVRPEAIRIGEGLPGDWQCRAIVRTVLPTGSTWVVGLELAGRTVFAVDFRPVEFAPGSEIVCSAAARDLHVFDTEGRRITAYNQQVGGAQAGAAPAGTADGEALGGMTSGGKPVSGGAAGASAVESAGTRGVGVRG